MLFKSVFALAVASLAAFVPAKVAAQNGNNTNGPSIFDVLSTNEQTSQFYSFLNNSGVISRVQTGNNTNATYTVFAPANSAFTPQVISLLSARSDLNDLFLYHIVNGTYRANQLQSGSNIVDSLVSNSTLLKWSNGTGLALNVYKNSSSSSGGGGGGDGGNGSGIELHSGFYKYNVIQTDIQAGNGVIHLIDGIMGFPQSPSATIRSSDQLSGQKLRQFYGALYRVGMLDSLDNANGITIFAPSDKAFEDENMLNMSNETLSGILKYHLVDGVYYSTNITNSTSTMTLLTQNTTNLNASASGSSSVEVGNRDTTGKVLTPDVLTNNGVIHIIDTLLMPPKNNTGNNPNGTTNGNGTTQGSSGAATEVSRFALLLSIVVAAVCTLL